MPLPALTLWADSNKSELIAGWQVNSNLGTLKLRQGDTIGIELHWVEQGYGRLMREVVWPSAANITLAIGRIDSQPTSGVFQLGYGTEYTAEVAYNATAVALQAALNALPGITAEGGVTVAKTATTYRITWNTPGVPAHNITLYQNDLTPTSSIGIGTARTGTLTVAQITQLHIKQAPVAVCTSWVTQDPPTITVTETHAPAYSGDYRVWRVLVSPNPKSGTFRLSKVINGSTYWTAPIPVDGITANTIAVATGLTVTAVDDFEFEISQAQLQPDPTVNVSLMGADGAGLIGYSSKYGQLSMNSLDVELLLGGAASGAAVLEIEVELDGKRQTLVQNAVTIFNDLIDTDSYTLQEWGDVIPADSVVRYDTAQALTSGQQTQARANIGAIAAASLTAYTTKDNELEARIASLESISPTTDDLAAVAGANAPSASNVFATMTDLASKADTTHTHAITDVTDLASSLASKADASHDHVISDTVGLQDALDALQSKADAVHSHTISDVSGLQVELDNKAELSHTHPGMPIGDVADALNYASLPSSTNPFATQDWVTDNTLPHNPSVTITGVTGTYNNTNYPYEIQLVINGTTYYIPARI
jgi:cytochrome c556